MIFGEFFSLQHGRISMTLPFTIPVFLGLHIRNGGHLFYFIGNKWKIFWASWRLQGPPVANFSWLSLYDFDIRIRNPPWSIDPPWMELPIKTSFRGCFLPPKQKTEPFLSLRQKTSLPPPTLVPALACADSALVACTTLPIHSSLLQCWGPLP